MTAIPNLQFLSNTLCSG